MATGTKHDYYELLGVPRKATAKDIRTAFRKLARKSEQKGNFFLYINVNKKFT